MKWAIGSMIQYEHLETLAKHLKTGELSPAIFNFEKFNYPRASKSIGAMGCGLANCVKLWPNRWHINAAGDPALVGADYNPATSGKEFFNINGKEFDHLFVPTLQKPDLFGGQVLDENATRDQVADNILAFCIRMRQQDKKELAKSKKY